MDEVVTHADVMKWLPRDVGDAIERAMPPEVRGWYTEAEASASPRRFVEVRTLGEKEGRYLPTD